MIYEEYSDFCKCKLSNSQINKLKLDLLVVKKAFEELHNSNLIHISYDEKYLQVYKLKRSPLELEKIILKLEKYNLLNFDTEMKNFIYST
jgi:hypothetical protein